MAKLSPKKQMDILNGSIWDKMLIFALPLAATGILQQLFNAADIAIVGRFVGKGAMAAVGSNTALVALFVQTFIGISMGVNVVISRFTGQGNKESITNGVRTAVLFALLGGVVSTAIAEAAAPFLLGIMDVPSDIYPMAIAYLRIYMAGLPVIFLYNFEAAIFMSQGDTRTPMICLTISGFMNVGLNIFFVCVAGMSAGGVALATVLANLISSGMLFVLLLKRKDNIHLDFSKIKIHGSILKTMIQIGLPAGLQSVVFAISNICIQSAVNSLGSDVIAAAAAAFNVEIVAYYILNSFGQACTTFIGQNHGAGNIPRCRRVTRVGLGINMGVTVTASLTILYFGQTLLGLFNKDPVIAQIGIIRLKMILLCEGVNVFMEVFSDSLRGYGYSLMPAIMTLVGVCGTRIIWVYSVFTMKPTFTVLMAVYPVSWIITTIAITIAYIHFIKKRKYELTSL